jgi:hypothetical protein
VRTVVLALALLTVLAPAAQGSLNIGPSNTGLCIGNSPVWTGVRLNFADQGIEHIQGLNFTVWRANGDGPGEGQIDGVGLGIWGPKAAQLNGLHFGIAEVVGSEEITGIAISPIGVGSGTTSLFRGRDYGRGEMRGFFVGGIGMGAASDITGIAIGGIGMGAGEDLNGLAIGGIGMGAGADLSGVAVGGIGMGVGENVTGIAIGGLGMGIGENMTGVAIGGLGAGVGGDARGAVAGLIGAGVGGSFQGVGAAGIGMGIGGDAKGLLVAGIGSGIGENFTGISFNGIGMGVGENFKGLSVSGIGLGVGERLTGIAIGGVGIGARETSALTAGLLTTRGDSMHGVTVSAYNKWDDDMQGLAIGLLNITDELKGVQLGLLNIAYSNPGWRRIMPIVNWGNN